MSSWTDYATLGEVQDRCSNDPPVKNTWQLDFDRSFSKRIDRYLAIVMPIYPLPKSDKLVNYRCSISNQYNYGEVVFQVYTENSEYGKQALDLWFKSNT